MSLRARLVAALLVLFTVGMLVYGVASYRAFATSELARLDDQIVAMLPVVEQELFQVAGLRHGQRGGPPAGSARVVVPPGTFAELQAADGTRIAALQVVDDRVQPDLTEIDGLAIDDGRAAAGFTTVPSLAGGEVSWRVAARPGPAGTITRVAVPMTSVEQALDRLVTIELVAGAALLAVLGAGAWLVLRQGLRPLERIAATTRTITPGTLDQRVPTPDTGDEVQQVATSLNAMLEQLEAAFLEREATEARLRRFLADASHELRTPLTSIQGYAELFRLAREGDDVDLDTVLSRIEDESARMRELIENLLALARLDEPADAVREPTDLALVAAAVCADVAATDPDRPLDLEAPTPVVVAGDRRHLRQAIDNLVVNAVRHTAPGTPVEVSVTEVDGRGVVQVRDHGTGLSGAALRHAFDRFWQEDPARAGAGSGLGLSIVRAVAAAHGGSVTAANAPDGGALLRFEVPVGVTDGPPPPPPAVEATAAPRGVPSDGR